MCGIFLKPSRLSNTVQTLCRLQYLIENTIHHLMRGPLTRSATQLECTYQLQTERMENVRIFSRLVNLLYSRVPNKRGGENNRGGWKWFDITIIGEVGIIGGGRVGEIENSRFLSEQVSFTYLCEQ